MGRVVLPNYPHHVVQRGHNRQVVFAAPEDYQRYLDDLRELKEAFGVKVYAYCLMTNHVHLLLTPGDSAAGLGQLIKAIAARATRYRNRLEGRSGTLGKAATNPVSCRRIPTCSLVPAISRVARGRPRLLLPLSAVACSQLPNYPTTQLRKSCAPIMRPGVSQVPSEVGIA